jgi:geranylgeranyl pyrophosphate synthase
VRNSDGPRAALAQAMKHARDAREHLQKLEHCEATDALASLTDYVVTRKL